MHTISNRNHNIGQCLRGREESQRLQLLPGRYASMTSDCPDGLCKLKIQAVDRAIGHHKNDWFVLLNSTKNDDDVNHALRFCEIFRLESKVRVNPDGYEVLVRDDLRRLH